MGLLISLLLSFIFSAATALASPPVPKIYSLSAPEKSIVVGQEVSLRAYFKDLDAGESFSIKWETGDGTVRTETLQTTHAAYANPGRCSPYRHGCFALLTTSHVYNKPGTYTISLTICDSKGEIGTDMVSLLVLPHTPND